MSRVIHLLSCVRQRDSGESIGTVGHEARVLRRDILPDEVLVGECAGVFCHFGTHLFSALNGRKHRGFVVHSSRYRCIPADVACINLHIAREDLLALVQLLLEELEHSPGTLVRDLNIAFNDFG